MIRHQTGTIKLRSDPRPIESPDHCGFAAALTAAHPDNQRPTSSCAGH